DRSSDLAVDRDDLEPRELAPKARGRLAQRGAGDIDRQVGRRAQGADKKPRLQALAAAVLDELAALSGKARDRGEVRFGQRELGASQVILGKPADALEQATAGVVVEILRRQRLLRERESRDHFVQKIFQATPMREPGRWPISREMRSAVSLTSGPHCSFMRSAGEDRDRAATRLPPSSRMPAATQRTPISASSLSVAQPWRWIFSRSRSRSCTLESVFLVCGARPVRFA